MFYLLLFASYASFSLAKTVTYNFDIGWVRAAPDGFERPVIGVNGAWPNPTIEADVGDTIVVNTFNSLGNQSTSLHFHGMYQNETNAYDGGVGVAQCPISPGGFFTYTFKAEPAGTHWYHSHDKGQYPDGLRGIMIIHDPEWERSLNIIQQIHISLSDWYHTEQPYLIQRYLSPNNTDGGLPSPDSFLFNDARDAPTYQFQPRKRYLLRIVSMSALACTQFHIDGHVLSVVGVDGVHTHPQDTKTIDVCAGQSYDVIVTGLKNQRKSKQWIAKMLTDMMTNGPPPDDHLSVIGKADYRPRGRMLNIPWKTITPQWAPQTALNDMTLRPLDGQKILRHVQNEIRLRTNQTYYEDIGTRIGIGYEPWVEPKIPTLYTALSTGQHADDPSTYGVGVDPWVLNSNEVVQIYMENPQPWPHPMHLHGHSFQVVARGEGVWDRNEAALPLIPMKRNTVVIPALGYFVLRFRADNPGVWLFHCHIDLHLAGGMASVFVESPEKLQRQQTIPSAGAGLCFNNGQCNFGNCACGAGKISTKDAADQCNSIFNSQNMNYGALIS